jgi:hypothetical protein
MARQRFLLQREATPGVAATSAMREYIGLSASPGYNDDGESFKVAGFRGTAARIKTNEYGEWDVSAMQDFNGLLPVAASVLGEPTTTQPDVATAATAYEHVMTLTGSGDLDPVSYTAISGNDDFAFQGNYLVFNTFDMGVQRANLSFGTSAMSKTLDHTATIPATGITQVAAAPVPSRNYNVYIDDTWADLGTTKYLSCYDASVAVGATWEMDSPINSEIISFESLMENLDTDYSGEMSVGLKPSAVALFDSFQDDTKKFVRIAADGPIIGGAVRYRVQLDFSIIVTSRGRVGDAPNSSTKILPFSYDLSPDDVSGNLIELTLTNTVASL